MMGAQLSAPVDSRRPVRGALMLVKMPTGGVHSTGIGSIAVLCFTDSR